MPFLSERRLKWLGNFLITASSIFFLETSFEMYFLTFTQGPQMLGFSLVHIAPSFVLALIFLSGLFFLLLAAFSLVIQVLRLAGRLKSMADYTRFLLVVLCIQAIHGVLLFTYDRWSPAFSR
jgi:hypothetical protein